MLRRRQEWPGRWPATCVSAPEHSRFKTTFVERAISPDSGLSFLLPRIVGYASAADLIFTSRMVLAER